MRLSDAQKEFCFDISRLIQYIWDYDGGIYTCTFGDAYRDPRSHGKMGEKMVTEDGKKVYGRPMSAHKQRLAVDLNVFKDGQYQTTTEAHRPFGEYWESMHPDHVWGGNFGAGGQDGNHYSRRYHGVA